MADLATGEWYVIFSNFPGQVVLLGLNRNCDASRRFGPSSVRCHPYVAMELPNWASVMLPPAPVQTTGRPRCPTASGGCMSLSGRPNKGSKHHRRRSEVQSSAQPPVCSSRINSTLPAWMVSSVVLDCHVPPSHPAATLHHPNLSILSIHALDYHGHDVQCHICIPRDSRRQRRCSSPCPRNCRCPNWYVRRSIHHLCRLVSSSDE